MPSPLKECTCDRCGGKKVSDPTWYYHLKSQRKRNLEEALQNLEIGPTTEQEQRLVPEEDRDDNLANQVSFSRIIIYFLTFSCLSAP